MKKACLLVLWAFLQAVPAAAAELRLTCPNGGETVCLGKPLRITWQATGVGQKVRLVLRRSGAGVVGEIAAGIDAAQLYYDWADAGALAGSRAEPGEGYLVRLVTLDGSLADTSNAPFSLKDCGGPGLRPGGKLPEAQIEPTFSRPDQPPFHFQPAPRLQVSELTYNHSNQCFEAWVKNAGHAPFVGHFHWQWITDCGVRDSTKDIPPDQSALLETGRGLYFPFACSAAPGACFVHASFAIDPYSLDGRHFAPSSLQGDFPQFARSQFLMAEARIHLEFLHGSRWVECSHEYVITAQDSFDYDPATRTATFFIGFPMRNCGSQEGRSDHDMNRKLYWDVFHSPSNTYEIWPQMISPGENYSASGVAPGQGILVERSISLKVRDGIYMLHVHEGSGPSGTQHCVISLRFADSLLP